MKRPKLIELALKNMLNKPATVQYPRERTVVEPDFRGVQYADLTKCTGCSLCAIECPADAIAMTPIPQGYEVPKTNVRKMYPRINYGKCVYCYRCVKVCPTNAYIISNRFEIAGPALLESTDLSLSTLKRVE